MEGLAETLEDRIESPVARLKYPDSKTFSAIVEGLSRIVDEARFDVLREHVKVVGMDPAKVALMEVEIPYEAFLEYELEAEKAVMGVNMESFKNIVKRGKKGEPVGFKISEDKVLVVIEGTLTRRFLLPNLEVYIEAPEEIRLEHEAEATVISDVIKAAIRDAEVGGDVVEFEADEDRLVIRGKGEGRAEAVITQESPALAALEVKKPAKSAYDISYLKNVLKLAAVAQAVDVKFSSEKPLELVFKSAENTRIRYLLAPTI